MNPRLWQIVVALYAIGSYASAADTPCSPQDSRSVVPGALISISSEVAVFNCSDQTFTNEYLNSLGDLAASNWRLPIGWFPFPSATVEFEFSDDGSVINLTTAQTTSDEISRCTYQVLEIAAQHLAPRFADCLTEFRFTAGVKIPWNSIGTIEPLLEDPPPLKIEFTTEELERFMPTLDINKLDSFESNAPQGE